MDEPNKKDDSGLNDEEQAVLPSVEDSSEVEPTEDNAVVQQLQALTDALQRERADAMNLRRRHSEEMTSLKSHIKASVIGDLLPVLDNFERSLKHVPEDLADNAYIKGVQGVVKQFEKTLVDIGVVRIATVGEPFDPQYHEAVSMDDQGGTQEIVAEELQAGYKLQESNEVIRHAMVRVKMG